MPLTERESELLHLLELYISRLRQHENADPSTVDPFSALDAAVQRWLQLAIQCCLDLGDSVLARMGQAEPPRYRDIFPALTRVGVLDADLSEAMVRLTGYRNALAHAYVELSPHETWQWLREALPAIARFAERVSRT